MIIKLINGKLVKVLGQPDGYAAKLEFSDEALEHLKSDWRAKVAEKIQNAPLIQEEPELEEEDDDSQCLDEDINLFINEKYNLNKDDFTRNEPEESDDIEEMTSTRTEEMMLMTTTFDGYTEEMTVESESELNVKKKKSKSKLEFYFLATIFTLVFPAFLALVLFSSAVELYFSAVGNLYNKYKE